MSVINYSHAAGAVRPCPRLIYLCQLFITGEGYNYSGEIVLFFASEW